MTGAERRVLVVAVLASFVAFLDGTVVNVALPAITDDLGGGVRLQQWTVDAYLLTLGALILLAGSLSDVYGRVPVLRVGLIGFGATSVAIALAPSGEFLIVARALQGVAGALLVPSSLALITATFRGPAQAKAIGAWTAWTSTTFLGGPVLGGLIIDLVDWRWVFGINVLPILVTLWLLRRVESPPRSADARVDWLGAILGVLGLAGPVFALIEQSTLGWGHPAVYLPAALGVGCLIAFVLRQRRASHPMLPLDLFRRRTFAAGNLATAFFYAALSLSGLVIAVYLQQVAGFTATEASLAVLPTAVANVALASWFGSLSARFGARLFMTVGPLLAASGHLLLLATGEKVAYASQVLPGILVFALGLSMTVAPLTSAILGSIPARLSGIASATNNAVSRVAGLVSVAFLGVILAGPLTAESFHRSLVVIAALFVVAGVVSVAGVRRTEETSTDDR